MVDKISLKDICHVYGKNENTNDTLTAEDRRFVGLKIMNNLPSVWFPIGYNLSVDEDGMRKDIINLLTILRRTTKDSNGDIQDINNNEKPYSLSPYQRIILDFLANGYFTERETEYKEGKAGKISWTKTIKHEKPVFEDGNAVYLKFIIRRSLINADAILTQIHKFCVYKSFALLGWMYTTEYMPPEPEIKNPDIDYYVYIVQKKKQSTFNDNLRILLDDMYNVLLDKETLINEEHKISFGTYDFEYPWQQMIDAVFSNYEYHNKDYFFPHGYWVIGNSEAMRVSALIPDTIMFNKKKVYILDAKYYQYSLNETISNLPETASIQKQITYGDYAYNKLPSHDIFNAFLLPYNSDNKDEKIKGFGYAYGDWQSRENERQAHKKIYSLLLDTKWLMEMYLGEETIGAQTKLSKAIDNMIKFYENRECNATGVDINEHKENDTINLDL